MTGSGGKSSSDLGVAHLKLRALSQFRDLNEAEFDVVLHHVRLKTMRAGDVLFEQGERGDTMLFVAEGRLRVELVDSHGKTTDLGAVAEGQVVGEMAALDPSPRAARVIAASDGTVFELSVHGLREMRRTAPSVAAALTSSIIGDVTQRLRSINDRIERELNPNKGKGQTAAKPSGAHAARSSGVHVTKGAATAAQADRDQEASGFSKFWARLFG